MCLLSTGGCESVYSGSDSDDAADDVAADDNDDDGGGAFDMKLSKVSEFYI